jgi:hypothetical protein
LAAGADLVVAVQTVQGLCGREWVCVGLVTVRVPSSRARVVVACVVIVARVGQCSSGLPWVWLACAWAAGADLVVAVQIVQGLCGREWDCAA